MKQLDARLTKQHLSTKVFKTYFQYLRTFHPNIDIASICTKAGLPIEYFEDGDNWVSITFDRNFVQILRQHVLDENFEFKVGQYSMSREILGGALYSLGRNALTTSYIYHNSWKLSKYLNKVVNFEPAGDGRGTIKFRTTVNTEGLNEEEKEALKIVLPYMIENTAGYYSAIPSLKGGKAAKVDFKKIADLEFEISVAYQQDLDDKVWWLFLNSLVLSGFLFYSWIEGFSLASFLGYANSIMTLTLGFWFKRLKKMKNLVADTEYSLNKLDSQYSSLVQTKIILQSKLREAKAINTITNQLIQTTAEEEILNSACQSLTNILEFDRAVVLLADAEKKFLEFRGGYLHDTALLEKVKATKFEIDFPSDDPTKVSNVFRKGKPILIPDVKSHIKTLNEESQRVLGASGSKSFICVPIRTEQKTLGVLLVDNYLSNRTLEADDVALLEVVGQQIAITIEKQRAQNETVEMYMELDRLAKSYSRFVPWEIIELLGYKSVTDIDITAGKEINLAIVFCDIRGFTTMSEQMSPGAAVEFLNSYFSNLAPVFQKHNGIIDKFLGDGIMALFLKPEDAVKAMKAFQEKLHHYNEVHRIGQNQNRIKAGIGLHYGKVLLGAVGYKERLSISVVSDSVNLASRLDGLTKKFGVDCVCTDEVINQLSSSDGTRLIAQMRVDGRASLTNVYEVYHHLEGSQKIERDKYKEELEKIVIAVGKEDLIVASEILDHISSRFHNDPVVEFYQRLLKDKVGSRRAVA